jgi:hypothetical protein
MPRRKQWFSQISIAQRCALPSRFAMICEQPLAVVRSYAELVDVIRGRIIELRTTYEAVDAVGGLADRHTSKLLCGAKNYGRVSLGATLGALGIALVVVQDDEQLAKVKPRLVPPKPHGQRCRCQTAEPAA